MLASAPDSAPARLSPLIRLCARLPAQVMTTAGVSDSDDIVAMLIAAGADLEAVDSGGNTAKSLANKTGRKKSKELLEEALGGPK